jgi:hypothetical protein
MIAGLASSTPAKADTTSTISLLSSPGWCANVENHDNVAGENIWLWKCSTGEDLEWVVTGKSTCSPGTGIDDCFKFEDAQDTSLCLGAPPGVGLNLELVGCGGDTAGWYNNGNTLVSGAYSTEVIAVSAPLENGAILVASSKPAPSGYWWNWSW